MPVKVKPTERLIDSAKVFIKHSIDSMREHLTNVDNNETEIDLFPVVGEDREIYPCSYCSFQTICYDQWNNRCIIMLGKLKYLFWLLGVIIWNYGFPGAIPIYDVGVAILLKHIFDIGRILSLIKLI